MWGVILDVTVYLSLYIYKYKKSPFPTFSPSLISLIVSADVKNPCLLICEDLSALTSEQWPPWIVWHNFWTDQIQRQPQSSSRTEPRDSPEINISTAILSLKQNEAQRSGASRGCVHYFCFTSTEARWLIRDGDRGRGWRGDERVKARLRIPPEKDRRDRGPPAEQWKC